MELRQLRYFVAVAEAGHVTRAAERLGIRQPPLSQQIKALEQRMGVQLFRRHARGVALTAAGEALLVDARRILADVDAVKNRVAMHGTGLVGRLSVTFTSSAAAHRFTPTVLSECRRAYPGIELVLGEDHAAGIIERLEAGQLDCGLLRLPTRRPHGLRFEALLNEPMVLALPVGHRLLRGRKGRRPAALDIRDLREDGFILVRRPGAPGMYANFLDSCRNAGFEPRVLFEVERMMTNLNLVAAGAGVSVVPWSMIGMHRHAIAYVRLTGASNLEAPMTLAYREGAETGVIRSFVSLARRVAVGYARPSAARKGAA